MSQPRYETTASRAWLSLVLALPTWVVAASAARWVYFMIVFDTSVEDWTPEVLAMLPIQGPGFVLALLVGLILWILLRGVSKRSWQAAVLIGAVCHYVVPAAFIAVGMFVVLQGVDWRVFSRGLVDIATTLAVGAVVGGVMWRVAYRRAVTPPVSGVFE